MNTIMPKLQNKYGDFNQFAAFGRCDPKKLFMVQMPDDAMDGTFRCGELLLVESIEQSKFVWWDAVYYYEFRGNLYVKRLQLAGDKLCIISDNKKYQTVYFNEEVIDEFKILGMIRFHIAKVC